MRFISQLLNIRPPEWPRLLYLYLTLLVMVVGLTWGVSILEATFLQQLGVAALPWFFVTKAVIAILGATLYAAFADRVSNARLLLAILMVSLVAILVGVGLVQLNWGRLGYPLLYLIIFVPLDDIFFAHWYTYVNDFFDTRAAKRIVPILVTAVGVGGIIGGWTMPLLNRYLPPLRIVYVWWDVLALVAVLVWLMPRVLGDKTATAGAFLPAGSARAEKKQKPYLENIREGYRYVTKSSFLRWLALSALTLLLLLTFLQYYTSRILVEQLQTVERMSSFIGQLTGLTYLVMLPIQFFVLSRLLGRIGLGNAALVYPAGNLAICGSLVLAPSLPTAALAYFSRTNFYGIIGYTIESLLYNAVPLQVKARARVFISGFMVPLGALLGGALLLWPWMTTTVALSVAVLGLAVGLVAVTLVVRQEYSRALIKMLEQEDFSFLLSQGATEVTVSDPATLNQLRKKLQESTSHELTIFMAKLISEIAGREAIPLLGQAARAASEPRTRAAILDIIYAADLRGEAVRQLFTDLLTDPDGAVRQAAIAGLEQSVGLEDKPFVANLLRLLQDSELEVRVRALSALAKAGAGKFYQWEKAQQELDRLLSDETPQVRARGVQMLGLLGGGRTLARLLDYWSDPADEARLEAALAIESLPPTSWAALISGDRDRVTEKSRALLHDPVERVRQTAVVILGRLSEDRNAVLEFLAEGLADPSLQVRSAAVEGLARAGKASVPVVHSRLEATDPSLRKMAAVTLSRVDPRTFGTLVMSTHVTGNLITVYQNWGLIEALARCASCSSLTVLQSALREQNQRLLDEIFYLLAAVHSPEAVKLIAESLRGETARTRANALEALEALVTPQTANLIAPLFDPEVTPQKLLAVSQEAWAMKPPNPAQALRQVAVESGDAWLRTIGIFALGEFCAGLKPKPAPAPAAPVEAPAGRRGRRGALDLLGALTEAPKEVAPPPTSASGAVPETPVSLADIEAMLAECLSSPVDEVRLAALSAKQALVVNQAGASKEVAVLSNIEKVIFLKEVPFFQGMTVDQLRVLANVCEEEFFARDTHIYGEGDPGGALYVVVNGSVGIERERRAGSSARLANVEAHSYFGEMNLFDNSPRSTAALALQDTLTLRLRREPLIALIRQHPDLSLALINVLSQRLRETSDRVAELTRTRPRELHKLYDQFE